MISRHLCLATCLLVVVTAGRGFTQGETPTKAVDLSGAKQVLANELAQICRTPGLNELHLDKASVDPRAWPYLAAARDLEVLTLAEASIPSVDPVLEAVRDLPKLRRLDISRLSPSREALEHLVKLPAIQELVVSNLEPESAEVVARIKTLKTLTVQGSGPGAAGWAAIGELSLESLTIRDSVLRDEHMRFIAGMSSLKDLDLSGYSLSGTAYAKLARLTELKALDVSGSTNYEGSPGGGVSQTALNAIAEACTKLERLNINYCDVWDLSCLKRHAKLTRLDAEQLQRPLKVETVEAMLAGTSALEIAILLGTSTDSDGRLLRALHSLPNLRVLAVGSLHGGWSASLTDLDGQASLEELHVFGLSYVDTYRTGSTVLSFPKLPRLLRVSFNHCHIADAALSDVSLLPVVAKVSLSRCTLTGKEGVGAFRKNTTAVWLNLDWVNLEDKSLDGIQNLQGLVRLDLSNTKLSGEMLSPIGQIPTLRQLALGGCRIVDADLKQLDRFPPLMTLSLTATQITNRGLEHVVKLTKLEQLNLADTPITDESIEQLSKLTNLKRLDVTGTRLTSSGLARLAEQLPSCRLGKIED